MPSKAHSSTTTCCGVYICMLSTICTQCLPYVVSTMCTESTIFRQCLPYIQCLPHVASTICTVSTICLPSSLCLPYVVSTICCVYHLYSVYYLHCVYHSYRVYLLHTMTPGHTHQSKQAGPPTQGRNKAVNAQIIPCTLIHIFGQKPQ